MKTFREFLEEAHLYEMRKEDKVKGKKKTPLTIFIGKNKSIRKSPEGRWTVVQFPRGNPDVSWGRFDQGAIGTGQRHNRHEHGGGAGYRAPGVLRGKKKVPGEKNPQIGHVTPAQKVEAKREEKARIEQEQIRRTLGGRRNP